MKIRFLERNALLAVIWGLALTGAVLCRTFRPAVILPPPDVPLLLAVSLLALLLGQQPPQNRILSAFLAGPTFGLLPLCGGLVGGSMAFRLVLFGGIVFAVASLLFDSIRERLSSGAHTKAASSIAAFVLFLAGQCFTNIFF